MRSLSLRAWRQKAESWPTGAKLGLTFGLIAAFTFTLVGVAGSSRAERAIVDAHGRRLSDHAERLATALDVSLFERFREIRTLATLLRTAAPPDEQRQALERLQRSYSHYAWIGITDARGVVLAATGSLLEGRDVSSREWWRRGLRQSHVADVREATLLAPLLPPRGDGAPLRVFDIAAPLHDGRQVDGVLGAHVSTDLAQDVRDRVMSTVRAHDAIDLFVITAQGVPLVGPAHGQRWLPPSAAPAGAVRVLQWPDGREYLTTVVRRNGYRDFAGLGWTVVARQPLAVSRQAVRQAQLEAAALGALGALAVGATGAWAARRLLRPLREVADAARAEALRLAARDGDGDEVRRLAGALGDLVARLRTREAELMALTGSLEQRVQARTAELERLNGDLQMMAQMVAHDVRAPVASVAQLLSLSRAVEPAQREGHVQAAIDECQRVQQVLDGLLALSKAHHAPRHEPVAMTPLAEGAARRLRPHTGFGGRVTVEPLPQVQGDPVLLTQVWDNLIGNAMKFSRLAEDPQVRVSAQRVGGEWVFEVRDNGIGWSAEDAARLFSPFERLHRDRRFPGSGLGLSIVQRIVQRHGGHIDAQAAPGGGACVRFTLPADGPGPAAGPDAAVDRVGADAG